MLRQVRKGRDWSCPECGFLNFSSRTECKDCLLPKPGPARPATTGPVNPRVRCSPLRSYRALDLKFPPILHSRHLWLESE
eukprot:9471662-Pyramimonas_sp.AAC.1